ncbi:MAG: acriflavine resistance protein B [Methylophaga sp.]|uniref:efflux RND transporter permease subunit n=1 Tax=Methylophaga sp. UBA678 TaxID=1946901 RepID=UPI000C43D5AD|nr:efflux RND transporter permease subunit [Methylophaga sp. UBA678]MAX53327.1 acriflavine resistance protein B [Methylophaga sp.]|tara:strand:- start:308692 stop:311820 length:3129 start_codon:yes stop_codon:yes gene_type:complete
MIKKSYSSSIIAWFTANPVAANLLMILVIMLGVLESGQLRKEAFPSMDPRSLTISVSYDSGSAKQSEEGLAIKIEEQLEDVIGIKRITSTSTGTGVTVTVEKQSEYDLDTLLRDVKTKVDAISTFPADAKNPVIEKAQREEHSLWLQLYGDTDRHSLQQLAYNLKTDLIANPNISSVNISGWLDPMMAIEVDDGKLQSYGLTLSDVEQAINAGSSNTMTAVLRNKAVYLQLKASEQAYLKEDFADIPLLTLANGNQLLLGEVAKINDTYDDTTSVLARFQGRDSIALQVITTGLDDITNTVEAAEKVAKSWQEEGKLPDNVKLEAWYDRSESIQQRLELLVKNAFTGIVMVFILLALFLNLTVAFWVAMGLPFIFFGTLYFMGDAFMGLSLNEFTTFGFLLALGIVVDDAVVVGESVYDVRSKEGDTIENTIKGTMIVAVPTLFGVFTTVAAFYALSQLEGGLGRLYAQFAAVVTICLILSIIESKLILPAHLAHLNTRRQVSKHGLLKIWHKIQHTMDSGLQWFNQTCYRPTINYALEQRYAVAVLFIALFIFVMSMPMTGMVRMSFFPSIPGDTVRAQLTMQNDASYGLTHNDLALMEQLAYQADKELGGNGDIANLQILSSSDQAGTVTVELKPSAPYDITTFSRHWQQLVGTPEGAKTVSVRTRHGPVDDLRIELRANDDQILEMAGNEIKRTMESIPAISGIDDNLEPGQPQLHLSLNQQGRALGMTTNDLAIQILQGFSGQVVQRYQRNSDEIEVKVRYPEDERQNAADVLNSRVRTPNGDVVPLSSVANVSYGFTRDSITRIDKKRAVYISADVNKDSLSTTELVAQLQSNMVPDLVRKYPGLDIHFAGEAEEQAETESSMVHVSLIALLVIYMLLAIPLRSYLQPMLIMTAIPFGIVGAILGHWMNDLTLGILSLNGIIALSGVVVNDSLLLVSRFNDIRHDYDDIKQAISIACRSRLRAVLLTSVTTFAGLMPLLSETSRQAQFLIPAAVSLGYGIMFATVITLILIPSLLLIQHDVIHVFKRKAVTKAAGVN